MIKKTLKVIILGAVSLTLFSGVSNAKSIKPVKETVSMEEYKPGEPEYQLGIMYGEREGMVFEDKNPITLAVKNRMIELLKENKSLSDKERKQDIQNVIDLYITQNPPYHGYKPIKENKDLLKRRKHRISRDLLDLGFEESNIRVEEITKTFVSENNEVIVKLDLGDEVIVRHNKKSAVVASDVSDINENRKENKVPLLSAVEIEEITKDTFSAHKNIWLADTLTDEEKTNLKKELTESRTRRYLQIIKNIPAKCGWRNKMMKIC